VRIRLLWKIEIPLTVLGSVHAFRRRPLL